MALPLGTVLVLCLLGTACDEALPAGPSFPLNREFTLAPGGRASVQGTPIPGTALDVEFVRVSGDSRCPADAFCIQGGDALVHVVVRSAGSHAYELHTGDTTRASAQQDGWQISLVMLQPYPFGSRSISAEDYRATFLVSRMAATVSGTNREHE